MKHSVHAVLLPPGRRLFDLLRAALDGTGPAVCPLSRDLPVPVVRSIIEALAPSAVEDGDGVHPYEPAGPPAGDGTAVLIATSGSTGTPKIVELSAAALRHSASATLRRIGAAPGDRWLCCLPTSHVGGLLVLVRSIVAGTDPVIHERFDVAAVAAASGAAGVAGVAHTAMVPTQLRRLLDAGVDPAALPTIILGGAAAPPGLVEKARSRGGRVFTTYGMTETCGGCVYDGSPLDGVEVRVTEEGRVAIAGPVLFTGYRLRAGGGPGDGWFHTSDLGALDGGRLRVRGRIDDVINTGGEKVVAGEVERVLIDHPNVIDAVVVGRPDEEWGEIVTAVVVADPPVTLAELRAHTRHRLPGHAAPRALELVPAIPLLPSGKPDRRRLRTDANM